MTQSEGSFTACMRTKEEYQISEMEKTISELTVERESLLHEVTLFKTLNQDSQKKAAILKDEVAALKKKLESQQSMIPRSVWEFQKYKNETAAQILKFKEAVEDMQIKNDVLAQTVTGFGSQVIKMESLQGEGIRKMAKDFEDKIKVLVYEHRCIVAEIIKKHAMKTKGYESLVNQLKEEIIRKESEIKMCQMMLRDMKLHMEKEVNQVKSDMEAEAQKSEAQLKEKLLEMEKRTAKLSKWNNRLIKEYESKLLSIRRDKEIQIQAMQMQMSEKMQSFQGQKTQEAENVANTLELKYQKLISNIEEENKIQRQSDLEKIQQLEIQLKNTNQAKEN